MVISASRRTDIPAYYADWLMGRLDAGYCLVRNPFDARRSTRVSLDREDIDFFVLWTRDPRPLTRRIHEIDGRGIRFYVHVTVTGYPQAIEPNSPPLDDAIDALRELSEAIGSARVLWRYDPIFVADGLDTDSHRGIFERIASALEGWTERVTLSLLDEYAGTASRLARSGYTGAEFGSSSKFTRKLGRGDAGQLILPGVVAASLPPEPYSSLLSDIAVIAKSRGMLPLACAEPYDLAALGIGAGGCVDAELAASLWGIEISTGKDSGQRLACRCAKSIDIGAYGTCPRACTYCYADRGAGRLLARGREDESL